ncbi:MAG: phosphate signaling complex protein PhoU [Clostridia bacterium]
MRNKFDTQLEVLNNELIKMGALCESAIENAIEALFMGNPEYARTAISAEREIDQMERDIEALCLKLLLRQQPVARDLRLISAALKMITDMERIGDQASDIAEIVGYTDLSTTSHNAHISKMTKATTKMVKDSVDAFVARDLDLAHSVIEYDDVVDEAFSDIKTDLIKFIQSNSNSGEAALDILMIAKYLERIGDHATNIAEWVVFSITGIH